MFLSRKVSLLLICFLLAVAGQSLAQNSREVRQQFLQAKLIPDYPDILTACSQALQKYPEILPFMTREPQLFRVQQLQEQVGRLSETDVNTLLRMQEYLANLQEDSTITWLRQRALTCILMARQVPEQVLPVLREAVIQAPADMPATVIEQYSQRVLRAAEAGELSDEELLDDFVRLEDIWGFIEATHEINQGNGQEVLLRLGALLEDKGADCISLSDKFYSQAVRNLLSPAEYEQVYAQMRLQGCEQSAFRDTIIRRLTVLAESPYAQRLVARELVKKNQFLEAVQLLEKIEGQESNLKRKAVVQLELARLYQKRQNFRTARIYAERANESFPEWGRPYLFMSDLVIESIPFCDFNAFERKAVSWLAMEFCETAIQRNQHMEADAYQRIQQLRKRQPTREEVLFYGLQLGDRFPLRCWLETAARVRYD